jgi:hypothetical protein
MKQRDDLLNALKDVRVAYRVVTVFQRKVLDLCAAIRDQFDRRFYQWRPRDTDFPPQRNANPTDGRWAWDFVPLYHFSILYAAPGDDTHVPRVGDCMLEIRLRADDGANLNSDKEPDATKFGPAERSSSTLSLLAWYCTRTQEGNSFYDIWDNMEWPKNGCTSVEFPESGIKVVGRSFDLADLASPDAVSSAVNDFKELLRNQLDLKDL